MPTRLSPADKAVQFINRLTLVDSYTGQPMRLRAWQETFVRQLFAIDPTTGRRQHKTAFLFLPRASGKSVLSASILVYLLISEGKGLQYYSCAADASQAGIVFRAAAKMLRADAFLATLVEITDSQRKIVCTRNGNTYQALSSESGTKYGLRPSVVLFDELHAQPNRDLWNAVMSGFGASPDRLTIAISTAGEDKSGLCREHWERATAIVEGKASDPTFLPVLYQAQPGCRLDDEAAWLTAMPALGDYIDIAFIREECAKAKMFPVNEHTFRTMYLNQWTKTSANQWIDPQRWEACKRPFKPEDLYGNAAFGGLDLSVTTDWSSFVLCVPQGNVVYVLPYFWLPSEASKKREARDPVLWRTWERQGLVRIQEGGVLDHNLIADEVAEICRNFSVPLIAADRAYANNGCLRLRDTHGLNVEWFNQGILSICQPTVALETAIISQHIAHDGNDVLKWQVGNARTTLPDRNGNYVVCKGKSGDKIDGVIAMLMAHAIATRQSGESNYEHEKLSFVELTPAPQQPQGNPFEAALQRQLQSVFGR